MAAPLTNNSNTEQQHHQQQTNHPQQQQGLSSSSSGPTTDNSVSFQVPTLLVPQIKPGGAAAQPWPPQRQAVQQQQRPQVPQQQEPQFVVFEFFGQQEQNNLNVQHQQQKLFNKWTPFSPLMSTNSRNEQMFNTSSRLPVAESVVPASPSGVRFATVQLGPDHPSMNSSDYIVSRQRSPHRSSSSRLLFDNPMFRRLPNWHFFGDDRRLVPIPPLIPLLPAMPIERTLLYIAPNESSSRQLLLLAMLDMKRRSEIMGMPAIADNSEADPATPVLQMTEDDHDLPTSSSSSLLFLEPSAASVAAELLPEEELLLPVVSACPSSTSGVESMSSAEESATTGRSSRSTTPTEGGRSTPDKHHHIAADEDYVDPEHDDDEEDVPTELLTGQHRPDALLASSATDSCASSTPNSPPTFDRRIVRMSRGTRDAVRRLSRRFEEEEEEEEAEEEGEANVSAVETMAENKFALPPSISPPPSPSVPLAPPTILMMSTAGHTPIHRSRHCSAGSNSAPANNKRSSMNSDEAISRMDVLSERIRDFHYNEDQTHAQLNRKLQLRDQLYYAISPIFPMCGLYIVGSSLNGFGTKRSDLDLCLMITNRDIDQRTDAVVILSSVMRTLESNKIVSEQNLILAKVPILRIKFIGTFHDITVDLNVNNSVAIRNTHLMCYYSSFDWRVRPLVMVVKEWAKRHGINDSACSSFTSYSLVLMVIHYLQCGAQPSVLPNLQQMYPKRFNGRADVRTLNVSLPFEPIPTAMGWQFKEDATLSDLLLGFLRYYAFQFDFDADAISIRMGKKVNRAQVAQNQSPFNTLSQWHCICIEEPFTLSNAAHSVYDERIFQDIKKAFVDSYRELDKQRDLDRFLGTPVEPSTSAQKI